MGFTVEKNNELKDIRIETIQNESETKRTTKLNRESVKKNFKQPHM